MLNLTQKTIRSVELKESLFKKLLVLSGLVVVFLMSGLFLTLFTKSLLSISHSGFSFLTSSTWDPVKETYGALPFLLGTLITSILALLISLPFSAALSIFIGEYLKEGFWTTVLNSSIDLLAGIPSVIFGFWGLFVVVPIIRKIELFLGIIPHGVGILSSSIILALMIIPYSASISREVISLVPQDIKEAALSLGATPFEMVTKVILPYAKSGIFAGFLMSFGRAISETMAVTMLIGNSNKIPSSIFSPANTLSSVIANEFAEAAEAEYLSSLIELALVLFFVTAFFSLVGRFIIKKWMVNA
ncbi:phosphate ABC transporter permease subunit PstC [Candidatus Marinamargulisbacteria bacterium SCGC AAA071-K20]|nr:phosphate ABC transporter permease subunit PstC [Candidatus Marinamargulisbacteria bacterium SCGC AAA071-K20]